MKIDAESKLDGLRSIGNWPKAEVTHMATRTLIHANWFEYRRKRM